MTDFFKGTLMDEGLKKHIFKQKHLVTIKFQPQQRLTEKANFSS